MSKQVTRQPGKQSKQERRRDRREEQRRREEERLRSAQRRRTILIGTIAAVLVIAAVSAFFIYLRPHSGSQNATASSSSASANSLYQTVDGVSCDQGEHTDFHVHAHLSLYINGAQAQLPQNIGIAPDQSCIYWLHTHDATGVIHIEAPGKDNFKLGTFFKIWSQQFSQLGYPAQLDSSSDWQVYVNGQPYTGDFRQIKLDAHTLITMAYKTPNVKPDKSYNWNGL
jgi:hypothetical protein